jgi:hypothetical protein
MHLNLNIAMNEERKHRKDKASRFKGVYKSGKKWKAQVTNYSNSIMQICLHTILASFNIHTYVNAYDLSYPHYNYNPHYNCYNIASNIRIFKTIIIFNLYIVLYVLYRFKSTVNSIILEYLTPNAKLRYITSSLLQSMDDCIIAAPAIALCFITMLTSTNKICYITSLCWGNYCI